MSLRSDKSEDLLRFICPRKEVSFMVDTQETVCFKSGATSSRIPRYDLIPRAALKRVADRFGLGLVRHGEHSWNARAANQECLQDKELLIARAARAIDHALKLIANLEGLSRRRRWRCRSHCVGRYLPLRRDRSVLAFARSIAHPDRSRRRSVAWQQKTFR